MCGTPQCDWPEWRKTVDTLVKEFAELKARVSVMERKNLIVGIIVIVLLLILIGASPTLGSLFMGLLFR